ncbi:outer membrane protein [Sphingomonas crocodyli]|nr:outer membrane beta-barrel protein [Sphingomonas crocodyli]
MGTLHTITSGIVALLGAAPTIAAPFSGPHVGIQLGAVERSASATIAGRTLRGSDTAFSYGALAGYDLSLGQAVVGVQVEVNGATGAVRADDGAGTFSDFDPKWGYAVSTRAGFLATPNLLLYGRLGYSAERVREVFGGPTILIVAIPPKARWLSGSQYGGGAEFALSPTTSIRAEYRRNDYTSRYKANQFLTGGIFRF